MTIAERWCAAAATETDKGVATMATIPPSASCIQVLLLMVYINFKVFGAESSPSNFINWMHTSLCGKLPNCLGLAGISEVAMKQPWPQMCLKVAKYI